MKQILVIDDDSINLKMAEFILKDKYEVICVTSGHRALDFLAKKVPNLILLDLHMPEMDGFQVFEKIHTMEQLAGIPVVFLTADDDDETEMKLLNAGAEGYVQKPFRAEALLQKIEALVK